MILEDEQNQPQFTNHRFLMILKVKRCPILRHSLQAPNHNTNPPPPTLFPLKQYTPFTVYILFLSISLHPFIFILSHSPDSSSSSSFWSLKPFENAGEEDGVREETSEEGEGYRRRRSGAVTPWVFAEGLWRRISLRHHPDWVFCGLRGRREAEIRGAHQLPFPPSLQNAAGEGLQRVRIRSEEWAGGPLQCVDFPRGRECCGMLQWQVWFWESGRGVCLDHHLGISSFLWYADLSCKSATCIIHIPYTQLTKMVLRLILILNFLGRLNW